MLTMDQLGEEFRKIIHSGEFYKPKLEDLDEWTQRTINTYLVRPGVEWECSRDMVGPARVIKLNDDRLRYLLIMPHKSYDTQKCDQFYWLCGDDPNNDDYAVLPDTAGAYLISKIIPGLQIIDERAEDGSCLSKMKLNGEIIAEVHFPPGFLSDDTYSKE